MIHLPALPLMLAEASLLASLLPLLGIVLILISVMMGIRKRRRRGGTPITGREQLERMKQEKAMRGDLEDLMVEIEQLARRFGAQLDAKTMQLERLLREADERIARLEQLRAGSASGSGGGGESEPSPAARTTARHPGLDGPKPTRGAAGEPRPGRARSAGDRAGGGPEAEGADEPDPLTRSVYALADEGLTAMDIARRLNEHVGKVELMLALRKA